jgi:hypothetical protein
MGALAAGTLPALGKVKSRPAQATKGAIVAQSPGAGHFLFANSDVSVTDSLGPEPK